MNKKIVIATPVDPNNLGNRLQNYAVHVICKKLELDPITIAVPEHLIWPNIYVFFDLFYLFRNCKLWNLTNKTRRFQKMLGGWSFTRKYIKTKIYINKRLTKKFLNRIEYGGIGGDQIWSLYWSNRVYFCDFSMLDKDKKICFAPSIGKEKISEQEERKLKKCIIDIDNISVREYSGQKIIKKIIGKEAGLILDPVMMLKKSEWKKISLEPNKKPFNKFILYYSLGEQNKDKDFLMQYSKSNSYDFIDLLDPQCLEFVSCPEEFIWFIEHAEIVCTNSYHGLLMSIIFSRKFIILRRKAKKSENMNTRMETVIKLFHLDKYLYENIAKKKCIPDFDQNIDNIVSKYVDLSWENYNRILKDVDK